MPAAACPRRHVWSHATNTARKLEALFADDRYDAMELDVCLVGRRLMLAHHRDDADIDTSLARFLRMLLAEPRAWIVKFDFKDRASIDEGLPMIARSAVARRHWLVLNIDGVEGPGGSAPLIMRADAFAAAARAALPGAEISIGTSTGWDARTLVFAHGYTTEHATALRELRGVTYALRLTLLAQTGPLELQQLSANPHILAWGEIGVFERAWLAGHADMCLDLDLLGARWWVLGTYVWLAAILLGLCFLARRACSAATRPAYAPLARATPTLYRSLLEGEVLELVAPANPRTLAPARPWQHDKTLALVAPAPYRALVRGNTPVPYRLWLTGPAPLTPARC